MRATRAILAATAAAALGTGFAASAQATVTGYDRCPANRLCVFTGPNGTGVIGIFSNGDVNLADGTGPTGLNNNIESMKNATSAKWCFYADVNYNGAQWQGGPGQGANTIASVTNRISSLKRANVC